MVGHQNFQWSRICDELGQFLSLVIEHRLRSVFRFDGDETGLARTINPDAVSVATDFGVVIVSFVELDLLVEMPGESVEEGDHHGRPVAGKQPATMVPQFSILLVIQPGTRSRTIHGLLEFGDELFGKLVSFHHNLRLAVGGRGRAK